MRGVGETRAPQNGLVEIIISTVCNDIHNVVDTIRTSCEKKSQTHLMNVRSGLVTSSCGHGAERAPALESSFRFIEQRERADVVVILFRQIFGETASASTSATALRRNIANACERNKTRRAVPRKKKCLLLLLFRYVVAVCTGLTWDSRGTT